MGGTGKLWSIKKSRSYLYYFFFLSLSFFLYQSMFFINNCVLSSHPNLMLEKLAYNTMLKNVKKENPFWEIAWLQLLPRTSDPLEPVEPSIS
jgi:hypothetical protein